MSIGIDEVGRGCWAGPLLVIAARQTDELPLGIFDSKLLTRKKRDSLFHDIALACDLGQGWVAPSEIDSIGLSKAMFLGVERALQAIDAENDEDIIMDGNINYCPPRFKYSQPIIDADASHPIVSAASIYAKVLRDNYMAEASRQYPHYQFEKHVGYGTKLHHEMLKLHGTCELHRLSYKPIRALLT